MLLRSTELIFLSGENNQSHKIRNKINKKNKIIKKIKTVLQFK